MPGVKITELEELAQAPADDDVLVIVDLSTNSTKYISVENLLEPAQAAASAGTADKLLIEATDADVTFYPGLFPNAPGTPAADSAKVDTDLFYNALTNTLTTGFFVGNGAGLTGVLADSAARATTAIEAERALFANAATTADSADFATQAISAERADSATNATNAVFATTANFAFGADSANRATSAITADRATVADSAVNATLANTALTANFATDADSANFATTAGFALTAGNAETADSANNATFANTALTAENAITADSAINASNALLAQVAEEARRLGNFIDSGGTAYPTRGSRALGDLKVDSDLIVLGNITSVNGVFTGDGSGLTNVTSTSVALATEQTDAKSIDSAGKHYLMLRTTELGFDSVSTTANLTYDPASFTLSANSFSGDGSNLTNVTAIDATNAENVAVTTVGDSAQYYVHIGSTTTGNDNVNVNTNLTYNPFRGRLSATIFDTGEWEVYESAGNLTFAHNGTKQMSLSENGDLAIAGSLTQSATI